MSIRNLEVYPSEVCVHEHAGSQQNKAMNALMVASWLRPNESQVLDYGVLKSFQLNRDSVKTYFDHHQHYDASNLANSQLLKVRAIGQSVLKVELFVAEEAAYLERFLYDAESLGWLRLYSNFDSLMQIAALAETSQPREAGSTIHLVRSLGVGYSLFNARDHYDGVFEFPLELAVDLEPLNAENVASADACLLAKGASNGYIKLKMKPLI
ncbi:hypothetical protein [Thiomicrorhabdus sediminis]|uniref:Uncharacterized protein n=1 Tax=Thiomicrorhabdus sediminis TaxID=2580412 RepID=A0A4P9K8I5_9GAMM|nr:hypothetical protein [Thiomicrorhabdus sediminis]QCU90716.1 hypothetical protein FE785_08785 [Thiomicrorhabdus sediminis]